MKLYHNYDTPLNDVVIKSKRIMANVWGRQEEVFLTKWSEIKKLGFQPHERAFGALNDNTPALYFRARTDQNTFKWFLTTETIEEIYHEEDMIKEALEANNNKR